MSTRGKPKIARMVIYRSRTDRYSVPAIINTTMETLVREMVEGGYIDPLDSVDHVHLTVLTGGRAGKRHPDTDPAIPQAPPGGSYQEFNIPYADMNGNWHYDEQPPGTWAWPSLFS